MQVTHVRNSIINALVFRQNQIVAIPRRGGVEEGRKEGTEEVGWRKEGKRKGRKDLLSFHMDNWT